MRTRGGSTRRLALGAATAGLLLMGLAWLFRMEILLWAIQLGSRLRTPVGPQREITWDSGPDPLGRPPERRPPNIVIILADDLGYNDVTVHGGGIPGGAVPTPNIDSIAKDGVLFTQGYAAHGSCAPSRAAIMTGRYGTRFGFEFTPVPPGVTRMMALFSRGMPGRLRDVYAVPGKGPEISFAQMGMPPSEITLAELLAGAGYHTVHIGKWHLGRAPEMMPHQQGFHESLFMQSGLYLPEQSPKVVNAKLSFHAVDRFIWHTFQFAASFNGGEPFEPGGYLTDYWSEQAARVIEANRERPFFLYLAHWAPHTPLQASRADYEALASLSPHRLRVYGGMIRALDRGVGRVLQALRDNGLEENTLVMFTSDNGGADYIGLPHVNHPFRGWKMTFFEGGIRVPFMMKWPARIPAGVRYDAPVHGFDLYGTAAGAAGVAVPSDRKIDGVDVVPFVLGEREGVPHRRLFWRSGHYQVALVDGWKLQVAERPRKTWLFHLPSDPTERHNLAEREPERVAELRQILEAHNAEQAPPLWRSQGELPVTIDKTLDLPEAPSDEYVYTPN